MISLKDPTYNGVLPSTVWVVDSPRSLDACGLCGVYPAELVDDGLDEAHRAQLLAQVKRKFKEVCSNGARRAKPRSLEQCEEVRPPPKAFGNHRIAHTLEMELKTALLAKKIENRLNTSAEYRKNLQLERQKRFQEAHEWHQQVLQKRCPPSHERKPGGSLQATFTEPAVPPKTIQKKQLAIAKRQALQKAKQLKLERKQKERDMRALNNLTATIMRRQDTRQVNKEKLNMTREKVNEAQRRIAMAQEYKERLTTSKIVESEMHARQMNKEKKRLEHLAQKYRKDNLNKLHSEREQLEQIAKLLHDGRDPVKIAKQEGIELPSPPPRRPSTARVYRRRMSPEEPLESETDELLRRLRSGEMIGPPLKNERYYAKWVYD